MARLDDPNLQPGETEEQRKVRLVKAAKWAKIGAESRVLAQRSSFASRIIRLVFLVICGVVMTGAGIYDFNDPAEMTKTDGFGNQHFGPHGNAICITVLGLLFLGLSIYFLLKQIRRVRNLPQVGTPQD